MEVKTKYIFKMRGVIMYFHPQHKKVYAVNITKGYEPEDFLKELSFYFYSLGVLAFLNRLTQITDLDDMCMCGCTVYDEDAPCDHPLYQNGEIKWFYIIDQDKVVIIGKHTPPLVVRNNSLLDTKELLKTIKRIKKYIGGLNEKV